MKPLRIVGTSSEEGSVVELINVLVVAIRPLVTDDGTLHECEVIDHATGAVGTIILSDVTSREQAGDCPTSDLVEVERAVVAWRSPSS
jgi:hypothetical protein